MKILLGSTNEHKISAVKQVFKKLFPNENVQIKGIKADSEINEQPLGHEETIGGALNRLKNAKLLYEGDFDYAIAIENGLFPVSVKGKKRFFDAAWVAVEDAKGRQTISLSSGLEFSEKAINKALTRDGGFKTTTVGLIIAQETNCDATDPQSFMTNGLVSRVDMLKQAIEIALGQLQRNATSKRW